MGHNHFGGAAAARPAVNGGLNKIPAGVYCLAGPSMVVGERWLWASRSDRLTHGRSQRSERMCRPATCRVCHKATYTGCGQHVEQVLRGVPKDQRCSCPPTAHPVDIRSVLGRLLRR